MILFWSTSPERPILQMALPDTRITQKMQRKSKTARYFPSQPSDASLLWLYDDSTRLKRTYDSSLYKPSPKARSPTNASKQKLINKLQLQRSNPRRNNYSHGMTVYCYLTTSSMYLTTTHCA